MPTIREAIFNLTGKTPSDEDVQRIMAAGLAIGVRENDPMLMMFIIFEHYHGLYSEAPGKIESAVKKAELSASRVARASIESATANMIPGVQKAVEKAAKESMISVQIGSSMITIWAGIILLSIVFGVGCVVGSHIFSRLASEAITLKQFWQMVGWNIGVGFIFSTLFFTALHFLKTKNTTLSYSLFSVSAGFVLVDVLNLFQLLKFPVF